MQRAAEAYERACSKHPFFATDLCHGHARQGVTWDAVASVLSLVLEEQTRVHDSGGEAYVTADAVLRVELAELYDAWLRRDFERALHKVDNAMAVLMRMNDMIENEMERGEK